MSRESYFYEVNEISGHFCYTKKFFRNKEKAIKLYHKIIETYDRITNDEMFNVVNSTYDKGILINEIFIIYDKNSNEVVRIILRDCKFEDVK